MENKTTSIVVTAIGALILLASLTADIAGLGDQVAFGPVQTTGSIIGIILLGIGAYLYKKTSTGTHADN